MSAEPKPRAAGERVLAGWPAGLPFLGFLRRYRLELEKRGIDLDDVAAAVALAVEDALDWHAFMKARELKRLHKERDDALRSFHRVASNLRRLCKNERVMYRGAEVGAALARVDRLLRLQPLPVVVIWKRRPGRTEYVIMRPRDGLPAHRAKKRWRGEADRKLCDIGVPQEIRRALLSDIDHRARTAVARTLK